MNAWIPVSRELPDDEITVLIHVPDDASETVWLGYKESDSWYCVEGMPLLHPVTHWMHLPEPPATEVSGSTGGGNQPKTHT